MKRIGITGQYGFIGSYLFNRISLRKEEFALVPFKREYFDNAGELSGWVSQCDVIVHLAAMNRHPDPQVVHDTNVELTAKLLEALKSTQAAPHVIFSSSTQEERENPYGQSKRQGRELLREWAAEIHAPFTGMVIPNVFGPFGKPFYNSVVATFCHQLCTGEQPHIDNDGQLKLIYVDELADHIIAAIREAKNDPLWLVPHTTECYVSEILEKLESYRDLYLEEGIFPALPDKFSIQLFNTFRSFIDHASYFPYKLKQHADNRGVFVEMVKLQQGGQVSFSTTVPEITRGNHFHTRKIERFLVIKGKALIELRQYNTDKVLSFELDGDTPSYVDMPVWYTHNIKNIGAEELYTVFWINEFFDPQDPDTYFEVV
ncbi:polysaccharide biosynthesis C-terminal domain-containing protein [Chitinophaga pinensis]|uniref:NAD-dependent epimerase/dehydratase n=1 Tax=Chitinophaga pinensis (strain ATCC 43595 / DSM 2588 / LMG 13176 / NBRC 15968 / NCIMB 11800 / UQM 2034) TaxID=485918 RepID=A0A979G7H5_CHIPD|nr:NAD-dependent epimerase/dehydratase family protein [Chitinophaga pinensis]ACU62186.1 NAD-dependent epimerase/dehydratase [Chitinophaga pinensis DSM 2588]